MKTIRSLYVYGITFVSLEVIVWGTIGLLRGLFSQPLDVQSVLLRALALVIVGAPVFLLHWTWAKRLADEDAEEAASLIRAVFFHAILLANGIPLAQNALALINRTLLGLFDLSVSRAVWGGEQTLPDNLIAIFVLAIFLAYFYWKLRLAWQGLAEEQNFTDVRRFYRFSWVLYGLLLLTAGSIQILRSIFYWPLFSGNDFRFLAVNGLAFVIVGLPIWYYAWDKAQEGIERPAERESLLRLGMYALLTISSALVVLVTCSVLLQKILRLALGIAENYETGQISDALATLIPFLVIWGFHRRWLRHQLEHAPTERAIEGRHFSLAILALAGLITFAIGAGMLLNLLAEALTAITTAEVLRGNLATGLSTLAVGLPFWLLSWTPLEREMSETIGSTQKTHRFLVRRVYLYLVLFGSVLAVMGFAIALVYQVLALLLLPQEGTSLSSILSSAFLLALFTVLLVYHLRQVRRESAWLSALQRSHFADFRILILGDEATFVHPLARALEQAMPGVQIAPLSFSSPAPESGNLLIYPLLPPFSLPSWVHTFPAPHLMLPLSAPGQRFWVGILHPRWPEQAAKMARQIALGEEVHQSFQAPAIWTVLGYLFAFSFGLQLLFLLVSFAVALVSD